MSGGARFKPKARVKRAREAQPSSQGGQVTGPCSKCQMLIVRYGPHGVPLCNICEP